METLEARSRYRGCLLGGAVGDALGAPVEFQSWADIREEFGPAFRELKSAERILGILGVGGSLEDVALVFPEQG